MCVKRRRSNLRCSLYDRHRDVKFSKGVKVTLFFIKTSVCHNFITGERLTCSNIYYYVRYYVSPGQGNVEVNLSFCPSMEVCVSRNVSWKICSNICDSSFVTIWFNKARPIFWYKHKMKVVICCSS